METSYLKTLELDKIIARAAEGCVCKESREKLLAIEPQCDPDEVRYALEQTDAINSLLIKNGSPRFGGVEGVSQLAARAVKGGVLSMGELLMVAGALRNFQNLVSWYGSSEHDALPTDDLFYALAPQPGLEQQISSAILAPDAMADTASHTLNDLRKKIRATENSIRDRLESMVRNMDTSKYLQESVVSIRNGRYVVPVKSEYRGEVSGIIHDVSSTGATVFVEPQAVVEANARILQYRAQEAQEIERILVAFTGQVAAIEPQFQYSYKAMLEIDVLLAKARLALDMKAFKPTVRMDTSFSLIRARHPLIDAKKCVPVDISLGREYDSLIITGPNTGGKTVTLKTAGLLCAMAQCGFLIPADERSEICVFDEFLVDIGDEQSIEQSLSTFSAHMTNIVKILNQADCRSLCLFDELCAGTDPTEGAALAISILSFLHNMKCRTMATTHYSELKVFALSTPGVENACCEFNVETLRPTYKLLIGIPGKSNAFAISRQLGLPDYIIDDAKTHLESNDEAFEDLLANLEQSRVTIEKEREEIASYKEEISRLKKNIEQKEERLDERKEKLLKNANEEAQRILREAKETADQTIRNINKLAASSGVGKELEAERTKLREKLDKVDKSLSLKNNKGPKKTISPKKLKIGDGVKVLTMNLKGTVSTLPNAKGDLYVQMGILRSLVNIKDLELLDEASVSGPGLDPAVLKRNNTGSGKIKMAKSFSVSPEVNLIGMTTDEAMPVLDKYLDDAYLAHLPQVRVVHGRGTGALRAAVHKHLKKLKYVKEFRLGEFGEGDTGVTIVTFK